MHGCEDLVIGLEGLPVSVIRSDHAWTWAAQSFRIEHAMGSSDSHA